MAVLLHRHPGEGGDAQSQALTGETPRREDGSPGCPGLALDDSGPGQLLVRNIWLSLDPARRGWIRDDLRNYSEPVPLGAVMRKFTVGEVMVSRHLGYEAGEYGTGGQG